MEITKKSGSKQVPEKIFPRILPEKKIRILHENKQSPVTGIF